MFTMVQVALGGAIGAVVRYLTTVAAVRLAGSAFPYGTLAVNVVGSLAMGMLFVALAGREPERLSPLLMTGVLGGFTTFSAFSLDALKLIEAGRIGAAATYVGLSVGLSLVAVFAGVILMRGLT